jgi:multiple sugar transport system permease protein
LAAPQPKQLSVAMKIETGRNFSKPRNRFFGKEFGVFLAFVLPALLFYAVFMLYPLFDMFRLSLFNWNGILGKQTFIGIENYIKIFSSNTFFVACRNTFVHVLIALPGVLFPGFMLGFFLSLRMPGYRLLRAIFFSPVIISVAALSMIFLGVYLPDGIINSLLRAIGYDSLTRVWLANPGTALYSVIAIDLWAGIGFYSVLFFAALSNVPQEQYEAAMLDGAGYNTVMWQIAFPQIRDFFGVSAVLHLLWLLLGSAQNILLLTAGGPGNHTLTLGYYLYELAFIGQRLGYSQAIGVIIFFIGVVGLFLIRAVTRTEAD